MSDAINLLPLSKFLSTEYQVKELLAALDHLKASYFQKNQDFSKTLEHEIPYPLSQHLADLAKSQNINLADASQAENFFSKLQEALEKMPRLTLTISYNPTLEFIKEINRWVIDNLQQAVVLDFTIDENLIGGAKIAYKGRIVDYSVKKRMETMTQSKI